MGAPRVDAFLPVEAESLGPPAQRRHDIPEGSSQPGFHEVATLAADLLRAPVALISLIDEHRQRPLASIGIDDAELPCTWAFCKHALGAGGGVFVMNDAAADARFADTPLVVSGQRIRFYAGAPIVTPNGRALGTMCVLSPQPRPFGIAPAERRRLASLAAITMRALETCSAARCAPRPEEEANTWRAREEWLRSALAAAGGCAWELDPLTGLSTWDAPAQSMFGVPGRLPFADALRCFVHPEDADAVRNAVAHALDPDGDGRCAVEHRGLLPGADDRPRWFRSVGQRRGRADGGERGAGAPRLVCASLDITEQRAAGERQALVLAEMNHRVKNTLTVVLALAEQSLRATGGGPEKERFHADFRARLLALSRAHDLLTREAWRETDLAGLVRAALAPFGVLGTAEAPARIECEGPRVLLAPEPAVSLAMALHELATNASKHGALSRPAGKVSLAWTPAPDGRATLDIDWTESGGPPLSGPPARRGFGLHLLERGLARQLGSEVAFDYAGTGLSCRLRLPLGDRVALG